MPATQFQCPSCHVILKPARPVPDGRKIKCPKCAKIFVPSALAKKASPARPAPAHKPDEDDGPDFELVEEDGPDFEVVEDEEPDFEVVEEDEPKPPRRKVEPRNDEALTSKAISSREAPHPVGKRRRDDEEDEADDRPVKRRRSRDDDDDEADDRPVKRRRSGDDDDEEDEHATKHRGRRDDDEDDDRPVKKRPSRDEDEDDEERPATHRQARDSDYDEEEDDYEDERPAKRWKRTKSKKSGGKLLLVLGIVGGVVLLLGLVGGGVGYWLWTKPVIPSNEWSEFNPPDGSFSVVMPGIPKNENAGGNKKVPGAEMYTLERKQDEIEFAVGYLDTAAENPFKGQSFNTVCTQFRDSLAKEKSAKTTKESDISLAGHSGKEYQLESPTHGTAVLRFYDVKGSSGDRIYLVGVAGKAVKPGRKDAAKCFDSFKIK
jgi:hypothetical protein